MAEGARLESVYAGNRIEGSNPSPSANPLSHYFNDGFYHFELRDYPVASETYRLYRVTVR